MDIDIHGRDVEGLEHDLGHSLSVGLRVEGGLSEQDWVLLRGDTKFVVEGMVLLKYEVRKSIRCLIERTDQAPS